MKLRFTLVNRLYLAFGFVTIAVIFSSALTFFTLQSNKRISEQVAQVYTPSIVYLNDLINVVNDSRMLIKNWVYIEQKSPTPDKIRLQNLHSFEFPKIIERINPLKIHWKKEENEQITRAERVLMDTLFPMHKSIMAQLNSFESYDDPMVIFEVRPMVEDGGQVMVFTDQVLEMLVGIRSTINKRSDEVNSDMISSMDEFQRTIIIMGLILIIVSLSTAYFISRATVKPILRLRQFLLLMTKGVLPDEKMDVSDDEIGDMSRALNQFVDSMKNTSQFALGIGKGDFEASFEALGDEDILGNSLLTMRKDLKRAHDEEMRRKREDEIRSWKTQGMAKFGDILRQSSNIDELAYSVVRNVLEYMGAIQGAMYVIEDSDETDKHFRLAAAVAYGRRKLITRRCELEEGLVGRCAFEKATVYLKQVPNDYVRITSGLGDDNPTVILLIPLNANEINFGVIEVASFKPFEKYQIEFLEQVSENIAGTLATVKINEKTARLLEESQQKGEELSAQEEEMRQNMEELQATQEESARREVEMREIFEAINNTSGNIEIDLTGVITSVNDKYAQMLNLKVGEIVGREHKNLVKLAQKQESRYREMWEGFFAGIPAEFDLCYPTSFGDIWLRETYTPLKNESGDYVKVLALVVDVTDNKTKDKAIHAYKRELDEQGISLKQVIEQMSSLKEQFEQREQELLKEHEISEEENRVQFESMKMQIDELEERLNETSKDD